MPSVLASEVEATMTRHDVPHQPVLLAEAVDLLGVGPGAIVVDATLGPGGHAEALLARVGESGRVIGIDRDPAALSFAGRRLEWAQGRFTALHGDHRDIVPVLHDAGIATVDAILADLGISSYQLDDPARGFGFQADGPLDMRMDPSSGLPTAAELLAALDERELAALISRWGEEREARRIARAIVRRRTEGPLETTRQLARLVEDTLGPAARRFKIHPATRTFQALRIAVNSEIEGLAAFVAGAVSILRRGGRLAVITFHSLEDRAVKQTMRDLAHRCICPPGLPVCACGREDLVRILTPRPVVPGDDEVRANPRARSAKLRAVERL